MRIARQITCWNLQQSATEAIPTCVRNFKQSNPSDPQTQSRVTTKHEHHTSTVPERQQSERLLARIWNRGDNLRHKTPFFVFSDEQKVNMQCP